MSTYFNTLIYLKIVVFFFPASIFWFSNLLFFVAFSPFLVFLFIDFLFLVFQNTHFPLQYFSFILLSISIKSTTPFLRSFSSIRCSLNKSEHLRQQDVNDQDEITGLPPHLLHQVFTVFLIYSRSKGIAEHSLCHQMLMRNKTCFIIIFVTKSIDYRIMI